MVKICPVVKWSGIPFHMTYHSKTRYKNVQISDETSFSNVYCNDLNQFSSTQATTYVKMLSQFSDSTSWQSTSSPRLTSAKAVVKVTWPSVPWTGTWVALMDYLKFIANVDSALPRPLERKQSPSICLVVSIDLFLTFFVPFLYNGVYWILLVLSICDVQIKEESTVCKCECEAQRNIVFEHKTLS